MSSQYITAVLVNWDIPTRSKAVEQALGWVAQKIGLLVIVLFLGVIIKVESVFQDSQKSLQAMIAKIQICSKLNAQILRRMMSRRSFMRTESWSRQV